MTKLRNADDAVRLPRHTCSRHPWQNVIANNLVMLYVKSTMACLCLAAAAKTNLFECRHVAALKLMANCNPTTLSSNKTAILPHCSSFCISAVHAYHRPQLHWCACPADQRRTVHCHVTRVQPITLCYARLPKVPSFSAMLALSIASTHWQLTPLEIHAEVIAGKMTVLSSSRLHGAHAVWRVRSFTGQKHPRAMQQNWSRRGIAKLQRITKIA